MTIPGVCPSCGSSAPLEFFLEDAAARAGLQAALRLWPAALRDQVPRYLGLHAPAKKRIAWPKLTRVITEMVDLVNSGQVTRNRETRAAPLTAWAAGVTEVLSMRDAGRLDLPLDGHALLCEIVWRQANRQQVAQEAATRPLHPSHRPAPTREEWDQQRRSGAVHVGALLGRLRPVDDSPDRETEEPDHEIE